MLPPRVGTVNVVSELPYRERTQENIRRSAWPRRSRPAVIGRSKKEGCADHWNASGSQHVLDYMNQWRFSHIKTHVDRPNLAVFVLSCSTGLISKRYSSISSPPSPVGSIHRARRALPTERVSDIFSPARFRIISVRALVPLGIIRLDDLVAP